MHSWFIAQIKHKFERRDLGRIRCVLRIYFAKYFAALRRWAYIIQVLVFAPVVGNSQFDDV